jgi:hypothetical protein
MADRMGLKNAFNPPRSRAKNWEKIVETMDVIFSASKRMRWG